MCGLWAAIVPTVNAEERGGRDKLVDLFADSMDLSRDLGRLDTYMLCEQMQQEPLNSKGESRALKRLS